MTKPKSILALIVVLVVGGALTVLIIYDRLHPTIDKDHDGSPDEMFHYSLKGQLESLEKDRNGDGKIDYKEWFTNEVIARSEADLNKNGIFEIRSRFDGQGRMVEMDRDINEDGKIDTIVRIDPVADRQVWVKEDKDGDGTYETVKELVPDALKNFP